MNCNKQIYKLTVSWFVLQCVTDVYAQCSNLSYMRLLLYSVDIDSGLRTNNHFNQWCDFWRLQI